MKILFLISTVNKKKKGNGGHYYSLLTIAEAISKIHEINIVHIGTISSIALNNSNLEVEEILSPQYNTINILSRLDKLVKQIEPDILHSFDVASYFFTRLISLKYRIPTILTKCGGRNPKIYFPYAPNLILFSKENELYFNTSTKFKQTKIHLIPNRVNDVKVDNERIEQLKQEIDIAKYDTIILRITRIGNSYKKVNFQLINLLHSLRKQNINCCLVFIGTIEDIEIKESLLKGAEHVYVVSEERFTVNAKELIDFADIVHGTGRSFMEACSLSKMMLVPTVNLEYPVLFTKENYINVLNQNISGRYKEKKYNNEMVVNEIVDLLKNSNRQSEVKTFAKEVFDKYFSINAAMNNYTEIYENTQYIKSIRIFDLFLNYLFIKKTRIRG